MLTQEEHVEIHALNKRGWTISEIAHHVGRGRKTVRAYLSCERELRVRVAVGPDPFDEIEPNVRQRLLDDQGLWATTLFDEVAALGYDRSYPTFTRHIRERQLHPHCEACSGVKGRATVIVEHPSGEEVQWDWDELGTCPWEPTMDVPLLAICEVVSASRTAPTNMQRQFHHTSDVLCAYGLEIIRHGGTLSYGPRQHVHSRLNVASSPAAVEQERSENTHRRIHGTHTVPE